MAAFTHEIFLFIILIGLCHSVDSIQLTTKARSKLSAADLQDFLSRPVHWPQIVASSNRVSNENPNDPLLPGRSVEEYFGLGLLSVKWICRESKPASCLVVESPAGVPGIAKDCLMRFDFQDNEVTLTMGYEPVSPLAVLATPVLVLDNWIALNVLLPAAVDPFPLSSFRALMGNLYGVAGILHAMDLWIGDSVLFTTNAIPAWADLTFAGQLYATLWCAVGPVAWWTSRQSSSKMNDLGLVVYGVVEALGAYLSGNTEAFFNAVAVQGIVAAAWIYSFQQEKARSMQRSRL